ncbi:unnamed protein product [Cylindrotheca closterium]|uniref:DEP domain-containing protein n=1 Tax=Cylindrotheca closterium TaxID=2856 RepID=A0AAD2JGC1_9STRA|nr:unnamed protein product [Cylindrotheca closterium]
MTSLNNISESSEMSESMCESELHSERDYYEESKKMTVNMAGNATAVNSNGAAMNKHNIMRNPAALQQVAADLERGLPVRDHRQRFRTYKQTFVGTDCVDFLVRSQLVESRTAAVELGRKLVSELNLFEHATLDDQEFNDDHFFYRFIEPERRTLPPRASISKASAQGAAKPASAKSMSSTDATLKSAAELIRQKLPVRGFRVHNFSIYRNSFVASEAITFMVHEQLVGTRYEAVKLGQRLERELQLWQHIDQRLAFSDKYLLFRFQEKNAQNKLKSAATASQEQAQRQQQQQQPGTNQQQRPSHITTATLSPDDSLQSTPDAADASAGTAAPARPQLHTMSQLNTIGNILKRGLKVKDRSHKFKTYHKCFMTREAIDFMVKEGLCADRKEAEQLGLALQHQLGLWHHVSFDDNFKDGKLLFRFSTTYGSEEFTIASEKYSGSFHTVSIPEGTGHSIASTTLSIGGPTYKLQNGTTLDILGLNSVASKLNRGLNIKDRKYKLKRYRNVFVGTEAVDFMVQSKITSSREEAVKLGNHLMDQFDLFYCVSTRGKAVKSTSKGGVANGEEKNAMSGIDSSKNGINKPFADEFFLYRFSKDTKLSLGRSSISTDGFSFDQSFASFASFELSLDDDSQDGDMEFSGVTEQVGRMKRQEILQIGERLRRGIRVQNRKRKFKTYRSCFIASEAVDFMVQSGIAESREYAVAIGKRLEEDYTFFHHVTRTQGFKDEPLFFRFVSGASGQKDIIAKTVNQSVTGFQPSQMTKGKQKTAAELATPTLVPTHITASDVGNASGAEGTDSTEPAKKKGERIRMEYDATLRQEHVKQLKQIGNRIANDVHMVMISGPSGCGKRALVESTFDSDKNALFSSAKFEKTENSPFATIRLLFSEICKKIGDNFDICRSLAETLTGNQKLAFINWVPEAVTMLFADDVEQEAVRTESDGEGACIKHTLLSFLEAVCSFYPVILLLDDIMFAEQETLEILDFVLKSSQNNLLLVATYQTDHVDEEHNLMKFKKEMTKKIKVESMAMENLNENQVRIFLSHSLKLEEDQVAELATLMKTRTLGNMFFLIQLLETLQQMRLLIYDFPTLKWKFDVEQIRQETNVSDNVASLLSMRIANLPRSVAETLKIASCFGTSFDPDVIDATKSVLKIYEETAYVLDQACNEDLLIRISEREYKFAHEEVRLAAYKLLPEGEERKKVHWEIGFKLSKRRNLLQDSSNLFACVDQMLQSEEQMFLMVKRNYKIRIVNWFLRAGQSAMTLSAFGVANRYLRTGVQLLADDPKAAFRDHYESSVLMYSTLAQSELSAGRVEESRKLAETVLEESRLQKDKQTASITLFRCFTAESRMKEQLDFAIDLLAAAGLKIPKDPNVIQVKLEWEKTKSGIKNAEEVLALPHATDKGIDFCYDIMTDLVLTSDAPGRLFSCFATARMVQMTLKHGLSKFTPLIFILVGLDFIAYGNDLKEGNKFIQLGFQIQDNVEVALRGRVLTQACMALGCVQPISRCMYLALDGYKASMELGDIQNAFHGARVYLWSFYYSGLPFEPLIDDIERFALQMLDYKQLYLFHMVTPMYQLLLNLQGVSGDPTNIEKGKAIELAGKVPTESEHDVCWEFIRAYGMELAFYFGDLEKATNYYNEIKNLHIGYLKATLLFHSRVFFYALISIENYRITKKVQTKNDAKKYTGFLKNLVEQGAVNVNHKFQLLQAGLMSLAPKDPTKVVRKYERAIALASRTGFLQDSALGNYLCAQFCLSQPDQVDSASRFIEEAYKQYQSWGAAEVAESVKKRHPECFPKEAPGSRVRQRKSEGLRSRRHFRGSIAHMHTSLATARRIKRSSMDESEQPPSFN